MVVVAFSLDEFKHNKFVSLMFVKFDTSNFCCIFAQKNHHLRDKHIEFMFIMSLHDLKALYTKMFNVIFLCFFWNVMDFHFVLFQSSIYTSSGSWGPYSQQAGYNIHCPMQSGNQ